MDESFGQSVAQVQIPDGAVYAGKKLSLHGLAWRSVYAGLQLLPHGGYRHGLLKLQVWQWDFWKPLGGYHAVPNDV